MGTRREARGERSNGSEAASPLPLAAWLLGADPAWPQPWLWAPRRTGTSDDSQQERHEAPRRKRRSAEARNSSDILSTSHLGHASCSWSLEGRNEEGGTSLFAPSFVLGLIRGSRLRIHTDSQGRKPNIGFGSTGGGACSGVPGQHLTCGAGHPGELAAAAKLRLQLTRRERPGSNKHDLGALGRFQIPPQTLYFSSERIIGKTHSEYGRERPRTLGTPLAPYFSSSLPVSVF